MIALFLRWAAYLLLLAGMCAFAVNYTAWFSSFLFYAVLLLPLFSLLLSLWPYFAVKLTISVPAEVHRGDNADLKIAVTASFCPYYLPITLTVTQQNISFITEQALPPLTGRRCQFAPYPMLVPAKRAGGLPHIRAAGGIRMSIPTEHTAVIRTEIRSAYMPDFLGLFRLPLRLRSHSARMKTLSQDTVILPHTKAPEGKLRMWDNSSAAMTPTTRPSEQYEIRTYRPGDALRSVHWKLTAKVDGILVREAVEPQIHVLAIAIERPTDPALSDCVYDALDWMLRTLCVREHVRSVVVGWITSDGRTCTQTLYDLNTTDDFYHRILSDAVPDALPAHAFAELYKAVDRGYYLDADSCIGTPSNDTVTDAGRETATL